MDGTTKSNTRAKPPFSVLDYSDFRAYLKDHYAWAHGRDRAFSHRFISANVGTASSGWFTDILRGRQNLTPAQLIKISGLLRLSGKEAEYFESLVQFAQASTLEEKNLRYKALMAHKRIQAKIVGREKFEYYSKWYYSAIRELLFFFPFTGDFGSLAKKLRPQIRPADAREAIKVLLSLDFIRKDAQGRYRPSDMTLQKDSSFGSLYAINFLKAYIDLGGAALDRFPKEERHISGLTLSFSGKAMAKATEEIENLQKRLLALMDEDPAPERVYQMNFQFFPLTQ